MLTLDVYVGIREVGHNFVAMKIVFKKTLGQFQNITKISDVIDEVDTFACQYEVNRQVFSRKFPMKRAFVSIMPGCRHRVHSTDRCPKRPFFFFLTIPDGCRLKLVSLFGASMYVVHICNLTMKGFPRHTWFNNHLSVTDRYDMFVT